MDGVLIDETRFIPMTSILEINMETRTLWFRNHDDSLVHKCWNTTFKTCVVVTINPAKTISRFDGKQD